MENELGKPFVAVDYATSSPEKELDDYDDVSSVESSPLMNKVKTTNTNINTNEPRRDLSFLASANFSTDSIAEADEDMMFNNVNEPTTPKMGTSSILNFSNSHSRRYSISSMSSPTQIMRPNTGTKPRPKSAYFGDDSFRNDESPYYNPNVSSQLLSPTVANGRQNHRKSNYVPPPIIAPPYSSRSGSPTRSTSPSRTNKNFRSKSPVRRSSSPVKVYQPFNFQSQEVMLNNGSNSSLSVKPAHRKGHKYKHSSVSMNYFQEPTPTKPVTTPYSSNVPDSYPIPTARESIASVTREQKIKVCWSILHLLLSLMVFVSGHKIQTPELATLAHLIFYDSLGSMVIILVEIIGNFEVWNHASIVYPFGLGRLEVLIGFGLAASLIMVGFDLLSHIFEEFIIMVMGLAEEEGGHHGGGSHHVHRTEDGSTDSFIYYSVLILTLVVTMVTSNYILSTKKINKIIKENPTHNRNISNFNIGILDEIELNNTVEENKFMAKFDEFTSIITKNPTYILTLMYAAYLISSPMMSEFVSKQLEIDVNEVASLVISLLFCLTGWKLVKALGGILLLSYPSSSFLYNKLKASIVNGITSLDDFKSTYRIEKLFVTKVNYDIFVAGVNISMIGGSVDEEARLRYEISKLISAKLKKRQRDEFKLELTIDIDRV